MERAGGVGRYRLRQWSASQGRAGGGSRSGPERFNTVRRHGMPGRGDGFADETLAIHGPVPDARAGPSFSTSI